MFFWVTDFYSLEKIISAFPKIVLLYLKMTGESKKKRGVGEEGWLGDWGFVQWVG